MNMPLRPTSGAVAVEDDVAAFREQSIEWPPPVELAGLESDGLQMVGGIATPGAATEADRGTPKIKPVVGDRLPARPSSPARRIRWRAYAIPALLILVVGEALTIGMQYSVRGTSPTSPTAQTRPPAVARPEPQTASAPPVRTALDPAPSSNQSVDPSKTAALPPAATRTGWVAVRSPVDIDVWEGRRRLGDGSQDRIELTEGDHQIELVNDQVGFRETRRVRVIRGRVATVAPALPNGVLHVNAAPWADVWLDGRPLGTTPLGNVPASLGGHDLMFRHPQLGTRTVHVMVVAGAPVRASVDLREP